ncbi:aldo/keto reductase [Gudongella sp. DL1XJH-153]|uniref:aldo/keto reductase n=2 Tax=Bacillota TaxID=1239 RepID=UPI003BB5C556
MEKTTLGKSGIEVSRLCFGSLTMTPFQANLSQDQGAALIEYAFEKGISFIDTAEIYENYEYIRRALKSIKRTDYTISTKTYAYTEEMAENSLHKAMKEIGTDYIDIFLLHEQESIHTIRGHYPAIEYLLKAKEAGKIRALGISTHKIAGAKALRDYPELDILHPIVNMEGIGIHDGKIDEMLNELEYLYNSGKGIYGMKPLGGGHLIKRAQEALSYVVEKPYIHSIAIGMQSRDEIDANVQMLENGYIERVTKDRLQKNNRRLIVQDFCQACGKCVERCQQGGITIVDGMARSNDKCILCGYCATVCPEFCIKVI